MVALYAFIVLAAGFALVTTLLGDLFDLFFIFLHFFYIFANKLSNNNKIYVHAQKYR